MANTRMAMFDKTKGNFQNRAECSAAHLRNDVKTLTGIAAGTGAGAFIGHTIYKAGLKSASQVNNYLEKFQVAKGFNKVSEGAKLAYTTVQDKAVNVLKKNDIQQYIKKSDAWINKTTKGSLTKFSKKFKTKGAKTGFAIAVGAAILSVVCGAVSHLYKKGQIDQKYTDKANFEKSMNDYKMQQYDEYDAFMQEVVNARKY